MVLFAASLLDKVGQADPVQVLSGEPRHVVLHGSEMCRVVATALA